MAPSYYLAHCRLEKIGYNVANPQAKEHIL